jgi:hypothetical protein
MGRSGTLYTTSPSGRGSSVGATLYHELFAILMNGSVRVVPSRSYRPGSTGDLRHYSMDGHQGFGVRFECNLMEVGIVSQAWWS